MKRIIILTCLALGINMPIIHAQEATPLKKNNFFYVGPVDLFFNTMQVGYERQIKERNSIAVLGGFKLAKKEGALTRLGGNGELQYRINLLYDKEAVSKVARRFSSFTYFAPFVQYKYEEITNLGIGEPGARMDDYTVINSAFGGIGFGCRLSAMGNRFTLNIFAGGGMRSSQVRGLKKYEEFLQPGYTGIDSKVELHMGIAF